MSIARIDVRFSASQFFRWLLVIPAAAFGFAAAQIAVILITAFLPDVVSRQVSSLVTPGAFVVLGARVAPQVRLYVAGTLGIAMFLMHGMVITAFLLFNDYGPVESVLSIMLGVIGTVIGIYFVYAQERLSAQSRGNMSWT